MIEAGGFKFKNFKSLIRSCDRGHLSNCLAKQLKKVMDLKHVAGASKGAHRGVADLEFVHIRSAAMLLRLVESPLTHRQILDKYAYKVNRGSQKSKIMKPSNSLHRRIRQKMVELKLLMASKKGWVATHKGKQFVIQALQMA